MEVDLYTAILIVIPLISIILIAIALTRKVFHIQKSNDRLIEAIEKQDEELALKILASIPQGYPLDGSRGGMKVIHLATLFAMPKLLKQLLDRPESSKVNINDQVEETGNTPLHLAALQGKRDIVQILVDHLAIIDQRNREGWTALHLATMKGRQQAKRILLDAGADVTLKTHSGISVFELQEVEKVHFGEKVWAKPKKE